jgi:hypothetical protein
LVTLTDENSSSYSKYKARKENMRTKSVSALIGTALLACLTTVTPALCWNDFGHMTVAYLAYKRLTPHTRERVDQLLKLCPSYQAWLEKIGPDCTEAERNTEVFMLAATWPDTIKGDQSYQSDGGQHGFRPEGPNASQNIGYSDHQLHKYWHFVDQPFTYDHTPLPPRIEPNALTEMATFRTVLASDCADELKSYDLVWLIHIVGDVHQPLHCVTRVSRAHPGGDSGGNDVKITGAGDSKNLHGLWDWILGKGGPRDVIAFADKLPEPKAKPAANTVATTWTDEGFKLAKKSVYVSPIKKGDGPFEITDSYVSKAKAIAEQRAELGGARLAAVLNTELK